MLSVVHTKLKVIGSLALLLLSLEVATRTYEDRLSKDVGHLEHFAQIAAELAQSQEQDALHVLFLGNSMTRFGVDGGVFETTLEQQSQIPVQWVKVNPDNTAIADWYYAYRNFFEQPERRPDVIIIGFEGGHLRDAPSHHPNRLARFYCGPQDWVDLTHYDLPNFESRIDFLACQQSALWANRDRVQRRVLDSCIPGYRTAAQDINVSQVTSAAVSQARQPGYERLEEFLNMVQRDEVHIVFAAMPLRDEYELDPELLTVLRKHQTPWIDCRHVSGVTREMFPDGVHMTPAAAQLYSTYLARQMGTQSVLLARRPTGRIAAGL